MDNQPLSSVWQFFTYYKDQLGYGVIAATVNAAMHYKQNDPLRDWFVDMIFCAAIAWGADTLLKMLSMEDGFQVPIAAIIGYCGASFVSDFIKKRFNVQ